MFDCLPSLPPPTKLLKITIFLLGPSVILSGRIIWEPTKCLICHFSHFYVCLIQSSKHGALNIGSFKSVRGGAGHQLGVWKIIDFNDTGEGMSSHSPPPTVCASDDNANEIIIWQGKSNVTTTLFWVQIILTIGLYSHIYFFWFGGLKVEPISTFSIIETSLVSHHEVYRKGWFRYTTIMVRKPFLSNPIPTIIRIFIVLFIYKVEISVC